MKKREIFRKEMFLFSALIISLIFVMPFLIADETEDIDRAYACLEGKVNNTCSSLSSEERIFSLLAIGKCKNEVLSDSKYMTNTKFTAQAILALDKVNVNTSDAEAWLLSQTTTPSDILWYLEIESTEETTCTMTYSNSSYAIKINADKKINSSAGTCLSLSDLDGKPSTTTDNDYWLKINSNCYAQEFKISCEKGFLTTLLYQKPGSSTIYVSEDTNSASAGGTTIEKINLFCFTQGSSCDYETSLWATMVLNVLDLDYDSTSYSPYLVTMASENTGYLPDAFLYIITTQTNFRQNLLGKQKSGEYWEESTSGDKFYDTALALFPFQYEESLQEKINAKAWLLENQGDDGCWQGDVRDTAFILYSVWPETIPWNGEGTDCEDAGYSCKLSEDCSGTILSNYVCSNEGHICCNEFGDEGIDCVDAGYHCMSSIMDCEEAGGSILEDYVCFGVNVCCTKPRISNECVKDLGGEICSSSEDCTGGIWEDASDLSSGQRCCVGGTCGVSGVSECEYYGGTCKTSCEDDEEENNDECEYSGDVCCVEKSTPSTKTNYWWIWVLLSLIVLALIGIIFRDKLRPFWMRINSKFKKSKPPGPGFLLPPRTTRRVIPRRILPPTQRGPTTKPAPHPASESKPKSDIDEVLKKLKEMGK